MQHFDSNGDTGGCSIDIIQDKKSSTYNEKESITPRQVNRSKLFLNKRNNTFKSDTKVDKD